MNRDDFGEDYKEYSEQKKDDTLLFKDLMRIDRVWSPIIKNEK